MTTDIHDLGPLEQAVLRALVLAECIDAPLSRASIWRTLPGYRTALPNVRAALMPGAPLRHFVVEAKDRFVLQDRAEVLRQMAVRQGRADQRWRDGKRLLRGVCKLPWIEAVGIGGRMAWGVLEDGEALDLVVIAEGGRVPLARAALRAWRKAAGQKDTIRIAAVLDADDLALPAGDQHAAWWLLSVRPVSNEPAFHRLWSANPWAGEQFPNFDTEVTGGLPEYGLADRIDGKLAVLRRAAVASDDDGVLLTSAGRRATGAEDALQGLVSSRPIARACNEWVDDSGVDVTRGLKLGDLPADFDRRWRAVATWTFGEPAPEVAPEPVVEPEPAPEPAPEPVAAPEPAVEAAEEAQSAPHVPSRRKRGAQRQRATKARARRGRTSPASPEG